jgi:hypothetical protein
LTAKVAALSARVAALSDKQSGTIAPVADAPPADATLKPNFMREALGRFFAFVRILKHGDA